jgi:hypothetical protein
MSIHYQNKCILKRKLNDLSQLHAAFATWQSNGHSIIIINVKVITQIPLLWLNWKFK